MKYAHKINFFFDLSKDIQIGEKAGEYSKIFNTYNVNNFVDMVSILPQDLQSKKVSFYFARVNFDGEIKEGPPHTHLKDSCLINVYLKTNGEETFFYEGEEVDASSETNDSTAYHRVLSLDYLQKAESFIAQDNEAWLLKTSQPHSLASTTKSGTREILQIYFDEDSYDEIVSLLES